MPALHKNLAFINTKTTGEKKQYKHNETPYKSFSFYASPYRNNNILCSHLYIHLFNHLPSVKLTFERLVSCCVLFSKILFIMLEWNDLFSVK